MVYFHQKYILRQQQLFLQLNINNIESISENDDFFADLGGDSLSFMELSSRLNNIGQFSGDKLLAMSMTTIREIVINLTIKRNN